MFLQSAQESAQLFLLQSFDGTRPDPRHITRISTLFRTGRINLRSTIEDRGEACLVTTELRGDQVGVLEGFIKGFGLRLVPPSRLA